MTISNLCSDVMWEILSYLPILTLIRASTVCKHWHSIIFSPYFRSPHSRKYPWFFLYGIHNTSSDLNQYFAFAPLSNLWFRLPFDSQSSFLGADDFFLLTAPFFRFSLVDALVGGVPFIGNCSDIDHCLDVEMYNPDSDSWLPYSPLPADLRTGHSSRSLSSALFKRRFYVFGIHSCFIASFDLLTHAWNEVQTLRPLGVHFSFLISSTDHLVLAGICNGPLGPSFNLWKIEETTMEFSEIAIMPQDLLYGLFDGDEEHKFASLQCVGLGSLIYVFNEEYHKKYPAVFARLVPMTMAGLRGTVAGGDCPNCFPLLINSIV